MQMRRNGSVCVNLVFKRITITIYTCRPTMPIGPVKKNVINRRERVQTYNL